jgi:hypothetical protein
MTMRMKVVLVALLSFCAADSMTHSTAAYDGALTLTIENDMFTGSDNNYTNGVAISWVSAALESYGDDSFLSGWGRFWAFLPFVSDYGYTTYASWSVVQEMYTPDDIENPNPSENDQPYAGILYLDSLLYARKERWGHSWELKLGVVGPSSQADDTQKEFHELIGDDEPQGWHTQLPDEPVINLGYTAAYLAAAGDVGGLAEWRIVPVGTVGLGTHFTGAGIGTYGEVGWNSVDALGVTSLRTGLNAASTVGVGRVDSWSVALFGGIGGYGVIHYLPLDGTVFRDSRSVDSEPFIGMVSLGFCVRYGRLTLSYALTHFTKTFETERENPDFGTVSLSWSL